MSALPPFHLAFPVHDIDAARAFYVDVIGCKTGREDPGHWLDLDMFGHQVVAHYKAGMESGIAIRNAVDGDAVPVPHFGCVLAMDEWSALRDRLLARDDIVWIIEPRIRFKGKPGEQATMFILDPSGNALEFKSFADMGQLFATQ